MRPIDTQNPQALEDLMMAMVGMESMAYIKEIAGEGFGVFAADGTQLATFETHDCAYYTALRNNLEPMLLH